MAKLNGMAKREAQSTRIAAAVFLFPAIALLIIYMVYPIIDTFRISTLKWNGFYTAEKINVGLQNWIDLLNDELFWNAFLHNLILMVCSILIQIPLGMALATFLDASGRKANIFKILWFLPYLMNSVAVGFLFYYLLATNGGLISGFVTLFKGKRALVDLLGKSPHALYAVIGVVAWQFTPFYMVYFIAGYSNIDTSLYEAAVIDGCNKYTMFFRIILPLSKAGISTLAIYNVVGMWNEFAFANTFLNDIKVKTLPLALGAFKGEHSQDTPLILTVLTLSALPTIILFIIFQDKLVKGMMAGAVKG